MTIQSLMREIIANKDAYGIWEGEKEKASQHPFSKVITYQRDIYSDKEMNPQGLKPELEGFQVGEPWNADLGNASILFLSSNPAITLGSEFPRWHPEKKDSAKPYTLYGLGEDGLPLIGDFLGTEDVMRFL